MNVGTVGIWGSFFAFFFWALPVMVIIVVIWFVRTLRAIVVSLRDIANRLSDLEQAVRDTPREGTNGRR